jgi:radical SAM superfamily enzyme YgiQ (UPF0313 family)
MRRKPKCLFINPPVIERVAERFNFISMPLAILYIGTFIQSHGYEVELCDMNAGQEPVFSDDIDIVGISCDTVKYTVGMRIAKAAKAAGKYVVMGGTHPTFDDEATLRSGYVDVVVRSEGEYQMLEIVQQFEANGKVDPSTIKGVSWLDGDQFVRNPPMPFIKDLDSLPIPNRELLDISRYWKQTRSWLGRFADPVYNISGSRGCPYDCSFCIVTANYGAKWRYRSVDSIMQEIEEGFYKYKYRTFFFTDDIFNANPKRAMAISQAIIDAGLADKIKWTAQCVTNVFVKFPEVVEIMAAAGCIGVIMGIESMDPETLKDYNKAATVDDNAECIRLLKKHGIASMASIIIGHPKETRESLQATMKYMCDLNPEMLWINILTPYVGTNLRREFIQSGRLLPNLSWEDYDISHVTFKLDYLEAWEIEVTRKIMTAMYYSRPKYILENLPRLFFGKVPMPVVKQAAC